MIGAMAGQAAAMHVARIRSGYTDRAGRRREYESRLLRRTYRDGGKVRHETLANLSGLPEQVVDSIEAALQGAALVPAGQAMTIIRSVPHGHVAAVHAMAAKLGLPALLGPACPQRDLALALIVSRVARPGSKLSTLTWWPDVTLGADLGVDGEITGVVRDKFGLARMVMVGDRGMITSARIEALKELDDTYGWITALRAPAIKKLMAGDGPLQLSLFDEQDLAEISSPDFPGERLIACRNPVLAEERARKREALLAATEKLLAPLIARVAAGRLRGKDEIGLALGKVIGKYKMAKHFEVTITDTSLTVTRRQDSIGTEALLDGIYVIRTPVPAAALDAPAMVTAYKNLKYVERDFRHIKADDLDLRPVFHRLEKRVKGHVLICMLAAYLTWHLRQAWAPLTYTDQDPPAQPNPVAPARRSQAAQAKASRQHDQDGRPYRSFRGLLAHLATLTRNQVRFAGTPAAVPVLTEPTSEQRQAFDLIGAPIPLTLKK